MREAGGTHTPPLPGNQPAEPGAREAQTGPATRPGWQCTQTGHSRSAPRGARELQKKVMTASRALGSWGGGGRGGVSQAQGG